MGLKRERITGTGLFTLIESGNEISFMLTDMGNGIFTLEIASTIADSPSESPPQSEV